MQYKSLQKLALMLLLGPMAAGATPILDIDGGQLVGASNVDVDGTLYDVEFVDGACVAVFDGCDAGADFTFRSKAAADSASAALLAQVLVDGPEGQFDSRPELTRGCSSKGSCQVGTAYRVSAGEVHGVLAINYLPSAGLSDETMRFTVPTSESLAGFGPAVWARWRLAAAPVAGCT